MGIGDAEQAAGFFLAEPFSQPLPGLLHITLGTEESWRASSLESAPRSAAWRSSRRTALSRWLTEETDRPRASNDPRQVSSSGFESGSPRSAIQAKNSSSAAA